MSNYYYGDPQLFKMPKGVLVPPRAPLGAFKESTTAKALPFIAVGIAAIVAYNILKGK